MNQSACALIGVAVVALGLQPAAAATGEFLLFRDDCNGYTGPLVVSNIDGTGRRLLPRLELQNPQDLSRGAPAVDALAVARPVSGVGSFFLYALPIDRSGSGQIVPGTSWRQLDDAAVAEPTGSPPGGAVFTPGGQHIVFVGRPAGAEGEGTHVYIADVARDATGHAVSIGPPTFIVDLLALGTPSDSSHPQSPRGAIDLSADGRKLLAVIYDDIWVIDLDPGSWVATGATNVTHTREFAEMYPRWSPAGDAIAFSGGLYTELSGRWYLPADTNIYTINPSTGAVTQVTTKATHKGSIPSAEFPTWSPSGTHILYSARPGGYGPRNSPCGSLVNYDLFRIRANGTQKTVNVTNTAGTNVEQSPRWGW